MDEKVSEKLILEHSDVENLSTTPDEQKFEYSENIDQFISLNRDKIDKEKLIEINKDKNEDLLNVSEHLKVEKDDETVEISKFAEDFVDPIMKEAIAMHKTEIDDEINDIPSEFSGDKKSDKSSSDDGFEHVKKEEVGEEERIEEVCGERSEGEEVKRELEDVVFQEEMRLESASEDVTSGLKDDYESDEDILNTQDDSEKQEIDSIEGNDKEYITEDGITKVEVEEAMDGITKVEVEEAMGDITKVEVEEAMDGITKVEVEEAMDGITKVEVEEAMGDITALHHHDNMEFTNELDNEERNVKGEHVEIQEGFEDLKEEHDVPPKENKESHKDIEDTLDEYKTHETQREEHEEQREEYVGQREEHEEQREEYVGQREEHEEQQEEHEEQQEHVEQHEKHVEQQDEYIEQQDEHEEPEVVNKELKVAYGEPEMEYEDEPVLHEKQRDLQTELLFEEPLEEVRFVSTVYAEPPSNISNEDIPMTEDIPTNETKHEEPENIKFNEEIYVVEDSTIQSVSDVSDSNVNDDINNKCKDIISWVHPISSALAFSILMFIELGLMMEYSIISILAYSGLLLMIASFLYKVAVNFRLINTQSSKNCIITFNKEDIEHCVHGTLSYVDYFHREIKSIAYVDSYMKNMKVFVLLWVLTYIGKMFNLQSLIFIGSLLLFSMPVIYTKFENEINGLLGNIRGQINGVMNKIKCCTQRVTGSR